MNIRDSRRINIARVRERTAVAPFYNPRVSCSRLNWKCKLRNERKRLKGSTRTTEPECEKNELPAGDGIHIYIYIRKGRRDYALRPALAYCIIAYKQRASSCHPVAHSPLPNPRVVPAINNSYRVISNAAASFFIPFVYSNRQ